MTASTKSDSPHLSAGFYRHDPMDKGHVLNHLAVVVDAVTQMTAIYDVESEFVVEYEDVELVVRAFEYLKDLEDHLPRVICWAAGYPSFGNPERFSSFYGCQTEEQATILAVVAGAKHAKRSPHLNDPGWQVRRTDVGIHSLVSPTAAAEDITRGLYT